MQDARLRRVAGLAAIAGGLMWAIKAAAILLTGVQPPLIFEIAPLCFAVALVGLAALLGGQGGWPARWGSRLALLSGAAALIQLAAEFVAPTLIPQDEDEVTILTPVVVLAGAGSIAALLLVGAAVRRAQPFPPPWNEWPLVMGIGYIALMALVTLAGAILGLSSTAEERLIELPVLAVGLGWIGLGLRMLSPVRSPSDR
jgi:hypothetical protein